MKNKISLILFCLLAISSFCYAGIWTSLGDIGQRNEGGMAVYDGNLFTADWDGFLGTYNDGIWSQVGERKADVLFSLAVYDGNLFTGDDSGFLGTYNNGVWSSLGGLGGGSLRSLAVYDGNLFAGYDWGILGTYTNGIFTSLGDIGKGAAITSLMAYDGNLFYVSGGFIGTYNNDSGVATDLGLYAYSGFFEIYNGNIVAQHPDDGCTKYVDGIGTQIGGNCFSLAVYDGNLFTGDYDGSLLTYNDAMGQTNLGSISAGKITSLAVYDGNLFTADWDGFLGTYGEPAPPEPEPPAQPSPATIDINPLFQAITGLFSIFSGIVMGVSHQSTNIGQFFGIGLLLSAVVVAFGALFVVMKNSVGGFGRIFKGKV